MPLQADVCVIGGGPGGYVAALRAAALDARVVVIEDSGLGGVCLNRGCIPSKALLRSAEVYQLAKKASSFGVRVKGVTADYPAMIRRKDRVVRQLGRGIEGLLKAGGVTFLQGMGRLAGGGAVEASLADRTELITAKSIIVATGSSSAAPPIPGVDLPGVIDSDGAFELDEVPEHILVAGAGAVGVEWATLFALLGGQVTLVEMLPRVVPNEDAAVSAAMRKILIQQGVKVHTGTRIDSIEQADPHLRVTLAAGEGSEPVQASHVLLATGRRPNVADIGLESAGVRFSSRGVSVNEHQQTSQPDVYAIGDIIGDKLLAHVASHQGVVAAEHALGRSSVYEPNAVPACTFTHPEIASVGLTEEAANEERGDIQVGMFPFQALGRARAYGDTDGFVKIVAGQPHGEILGMHVIGPGASDIIAEGVLAIRLEATVDDLRETVHAHPTFAEATAESAWQAINAPIHLPLPRNGR